MILDGSRAGGLLTALLPELVLTGWSLVLLLLVAWRHRTAADLRLAGAVAFLGFASAGAAAFWLWWHRTGVAGAATMIAADDYRFVLDWILCGTAAGTVLLSAHYLERERMLAPEYYLLLAYATIGAMVMAGAADLMMLFLGLELMSVAAYVLAGYDRRSPRAAEAALKYFLLGAFASGFLLYGIALVFGATGTTSLVLIGARVGQLELGDHAMLRLGVALLLVGFGFKVAAVPFHMWAPDVYDGAPTPVTGFMATAVKAAAFAALVRVLVQALAPVAAWREIVAGLALVTMVGGNLVALAQRSVKRMLAYSSVAHAGYLLVAVVPGSPDGTAATVFYIAAYSLTSLAAFALLAAKGRGGEGDVRIDDLAGLAARRPWHAAGLALCMLSLLGFPGTAGFIGKWYILLAAVDAGHVILATALVLTSVVSAGYYLPVIMASYMKPEPTPDAHAGVRAGRLAGAAVAAAVALVVVLGVRPNRALDVAREGARSVHAAPATTAPAAAAAGPASATARPR